MLARLYTEEGRYRDSFYVMRNAMAAHPNSDMTRRIQEEAAATFDSLFLTGKGDALSAIDALALFYDFRELTPIGRRGDEMIRRLADRLVSVDLLDQAADLLQYQVDHRLQGAARAQVATRLAIIYLMNRKPDRALATLRAAAPPISPTNCAISGCCWRRALFPTSAGTIWRSKSSPISKGAKRSGCVPTFCGRRGAGRKSAEQIELYYGERWKEWQPLNEVERADILRAAIGYALGEDTLGFGRFREKYAAKMAQTPDARDFEIVSAPLGTSGPNSATSPVPQRATIRSTASCATCRRVTRMRARCAVAPARACRATASAAGAPVPRLRRQPHAASGRRRPRALQGRTAQR